jgi:glycosyltransferase involved in cell wall biosynthesis
MSGVAIAPGPLGRSLARVLVHLLLLGQTVAWRLARLVGPRRKPLPEAGLEVLVTGTFFSANWVSAHLRPLAASRRCARVRVVTVYPVPDLDKVEAVYPPRWLARCVGGVPARLLVFAWIAFRDRPHVVGGFHLLINGLVAQAVAPLGGARSLYFSVGGPEEIADGGVRAENRLFSRLGTAQPAIERRLLAAIARFDLIVTMGLGAARFFRAHGAAGPIHAVPGGIDGARFHPATVPPTSDLVLVGRLVPVKRIDLFLRAVAQVVAVLPKTTALVVGDGPLRGDLEALVRELGIAAQVRFLGQRTDVEDVLRQARLFVLTSDSEGVALSVMEAMTAGLPAVVSAVGDLGDVVEEGVNGHLVTRRAPEDFAERIAGLLADPERLARFAAASRAAAARFEVAAIVRQWDDILTEDACSR